MITNEVINKCIDFIIKNIDKDISIDDVANYCNYSKYYFSHAFKETTGISVYAFIKRVKIDYSANMLAMERDKSITDIGETFGYSSSNYSTAFKKHHNKSPEEFRNSFNMLQKESTDMSKPKPLKTFEKYDKDIKIEILDGFYVLYERYFGKYIYFDKSWYEFIKKYKKYFNKNTIMINKTYDNPFITSADQCMYDLCITVDNDCELKNVETIKGGKYAVYHFEGNVYDIANIFKGLLHIWLPNSGYIMDGGYCLDIYRTKVDKNLNVIMDLCIPIK